MPRKYGWIRDTPDQRDHVYSLEMGQAALPPAVDLRTRNLPPVYDQGSMQSCTGFGIASALGFALKGAINPSQLFIYYNERALEGTVNADPGAQIRDGIKTVANLGACHGKLWPYEFKNLHARPSAECYADALHYRAISYARVPRDLHAMKACLASGHPFVFGFSVYESFESPEVAKTGVVPVPGRGERLLGGHCVMATGYNDGKGRGICQNSWGSYWGDHGFFELPYEFFTNPGLSGDFWTIRKAGAA